jgi:hypothetical protein
MSIVAVEPIVISDDDAILGGSVAARSTMA